MATYKITIISESEGVNSTIEVPDDEYILDAAEDQGIDFPYSCRTGACSTCVGRISCGKKVAQPDQSFLNEKQIDDGYFLPCVSFPTSDLTIITHAEKELY